MHRWRILKVVDGNAVDIEILKVRTRNIPEHEGSIDDFLVGNRHLVLHFVGPFCRRTFRIIASNLPTMNSAF